MAIETNPPGGKTFVECIFGFEAGCMKFYVKKDKKENEYRTCGWCVAYASLPGVGLSHTDIPEVNIYVNEENMALGKNIQSSLMSHKDYDTAFTSVKKQMKKDKDVLDLDIIENLNMLNKKE